MTKDIIYQILILVLIAQIITPQKAYAYIDPGTGSMVLQIIIASIIGLGITFKAWIYKLKEFISKGHKKHGSEK